jgi:hypothetical protein
VFLEGGLMKNIIIDLSFLILLAIMTTASAVTKDYISFGIGIAGFIIWLINIIYDVLEIKKANKVRNLFGF